MASKVGIGILLGVALGVLVPTSSVSAQSQSPSVTNVHPIGCGYLQYYTPGGVGASYPRNFDPSMQSCFTATLANCPGVSDLGFVFGYAPPAANTTPQETIVMLSGDGGTNAAIGTNFSYYVPFYEGKGYQVVEVAWGPYGGNGTPWEQASPGAMPYPSSNIEAAACRPATFLNYIRNGSAGVVGGGIWGQYQGGMCAHGDSGGAGALGYALGWYNAGAGGAPTYGGGYLDKVVMENGPVFTDIDSGCTVTCQNNQCGNSLTQQICVGSNQSGGNANGCNNWTPTGQSMNYPLEYVDNDENSVNTWSGNTGQNSPTCANNQAATTYDSSWQAMSIIPSSGTQPSLNYPNTGMSAWLCEAPLGGNFAFNNATAEGGLFYQWFTAQSQAGGSLSVNGVTGCASSPEDVEGGSVMINGHSYNGELAVGNDIVGALFSATSCNSLGRNRLQQ